MTSSPTDAKTAKKAVRYVRGATFVGPHGRKVATVTVERGDESYTYEVDVDPIDLDVEAESADHSPEAPA